MIGDNREWKEEELGYEEPENGALQTISQNPLSLKWWIKLNKRVQTRRKINYRNGYELRNVENGE